MRVLIFCSGNYSLSLMAEAYLNFYLPEEVQVFSLHTENQPVHKLAIQTMAEDGFDLSQSQTKHLVEIPNINFDYFILLSESEDHPFPAEIRATKQTSFLLPTMNEANENNNLADFHRLREEIKKSMLLFVGKAFPKMLNETE